MSTGLFLTLVLLAAQTPREAVELVRAGKGPEALAVVRAALAATPDDEALRRDAVELAFACKRWRDALEWTEGRPALAPERAHALFFSARYEEALALLDPERETDLFLVLDAQEALGRFDDHARTLAAARERLGGADPRVATAEGRDAARRGDFERAIERFETALATDPWRMEALFGLGRARVRTGDSEGGRAALEEHRRLLPLVDQLDFALRGVELDPTHGPNHARVGDLERAIGRLDRARAAYARGLDLATEDQRAAIVLRTARLLAEDARDLPGAVAVLEAEHARGFDPRVAVRLGDYLAEAGRRDDALAVWRDVLARRPDDRAVLERVRELEAR